MARMQQKNELPCSCIGGFFNAQEKLFLVRKKDLEEADSPMLRRGNKSSEVKDESEGKPQKKSLKKRPLSNHSADNSAPLTPTDPVRVEELRSGFNPDDPHFSFSNAEVHVHSAATFMPHFPAPTTPAENAHKQKSYNHFADHRNYQPHPLPQFFPAPSRTIFMQSTPRHAPSPPIQNHPSHRQAPAYHTFPENTAHIHSSQQPHHHPQKAQVGVRQERENWLVPPESLLIEDFDQLFNNRDENHLDDKPVRVRQAQRSRRFEKQQLVGRLAESDDDASSDPPSEVIGKGFGSFQDFWEEEGNHVKETFASRSTNTKWSELQRVNDNQDLQSPSHTHEKDRFGTSANFKSYKFL